MIRDTSYVRVARNLIIPSKWHWHSLARSLVYVLLFLATVFVSKIVQIYVTFLLSLAFFLNSDRISFKPAHCEYIFTDFCEDFRKGNVFIYSSVYFHSTATTSYDMYFNLFHLHSCLSSDI
jgi:hypothetical protein